MQTFNISNLLLPPPQRPNNFKGMRQSSFMPGVLQGPQTGRGSPPCATPKRSRDRMVREPLSPTMLIKHKLLGANGGRLSRTNRNQDSPIHANDPSDVSEMDTYEEDENPKTEVPSITRPL